MNKLDQGDASLDWFSRPRRSIHGPTWRWGLAIELAAPSGGADAGYIDAITRSAVEYWALRNGSPQGEQLAAEAYPLVDAAAQLIGDFSQSRLLKLMTLAKMSCEEMAVATGVAAETVAAWQLLAFDVTPLLASPEWIGLQVFEPERQHGNRKFAEEMGLCYVAGPLAVGAILDSAAGRCLDEADELLQRWIRHGIKFRAIVLRPDATPQQQKAYVNASLRHDAALKRLDFDREKLAARCAMHRDRLLAAQMQRQARDESRQTQESDRLAGQFSRARREDESHRERDPVLVAVRRQRAAAAQRAVAERIANCPLAKLTWGGGASRPASETPAPAEDGADHGDEPSCRVTDKVGGGEVASPIVDGNSVFGAVRQPAVPNYCGLQDAGPAESEHFIAEERLQLEISNCC